MAVNQERFFQMNGLQQVVHRSLAKESCDMADLYECTLRVLQDGANPGYLFLAAHSLREMINGLPRVLDLPVVEQGRLGDQVGALIPIWDTALRSACQKDARWSGVIDPPLQQLLEALHRFFHWCQESRPKLRHVATNLFRRTDPSGLVLPESLEKRRVERWLELRDYFVAVAHRAQTSDAVFRSHLKELEQILLESLWRRPSEDFSAIDAILAEEVSDA